MSLSAIIAQCVTTTSGVSGIGVVRDHEMFINTRSALESNFVSSGVINCVEIDRERTGADRFSNFRTERQHAIHFHVYYGAQEGSSTRTTFRTLVENIEAAFRNEYRLNGNATLAGPFVVDFDGYIMKCDVLCHYARCTILVREDVS